MKELIAVASDLNGDDRTVILNLVYNARYGLFSNPVLLRLIRVWKELYLHMEAGSAPISDLLQVDTRELIFTFG
jgi:hypothetical protein